MYLICLSGFALYFAFFFFNQSVYLSADPTSVKSTVFILLSSQLSMLNVIREANYCQTVELSKKTTHSNNGKVQILFD